MDVLAESDFFTVEVADVVGLGDLLRSVLPAPGDPPRKLGGHPRHSAEERMTEMARNAVDEESGDLRRHRYVLLTAIPNSALTSERPWPPEV
jgi:hypothetical protein